MYERNAIVLERYFNKLFGFNDESNLRENYYNYRKLFECYGALCDAKEKEKISKEEFEIAEKEISKIQKTQEKLYNECAKYEYSRYIIFNNIDEEPENIQKHLEKVNDDVQKNSIELKELGDKLIQAVIDYNEKNSILKEAVSQKQKAQNEYDEIYKKAKKCYEELSEEILNKAKEFINSDNKDCKKDLQETFEENGKNEKNQFDPDIILNTTNKSIELYKIELEVYLSGVDRISKLFEEIELNAVKNDKHTKYYRDSKAKMDFISAEKDYIVQFLDNERIGAIYDKKVHRKLMLEACKKFVLDFEQIDKLYDIISKEIAGRSTKKIYKENYNKSYLIELENASIEPSLDTGKMRQEAIAFMNLNYWRIEGIRSVYDSFEEIVTNIYEKDLSEFLPEDFVDEKNEEADEANEIDETDETDETEVMEKIEELEDETQDTEMLEEIQEENFEAKEPVLEKVELKDKHCRIYYSSKQQLANAIYYSLKTHEFAVNETQEKVENINELEDDEQYSIPEKAMEILDNVQKDEIEGNASEEIKVEENNLVENSSTENIEVEDASKENVENYEESDFDLSKLEDIEDMEYEEDDVSVEDVEKVEEIDEVEDDASILKIYFNEDEKNKDNEIEKQSVKQNIDKKLGFFKKLVGFNNAKKKNEA